MKLSKTPWEIDDFNNTVVWGADNEYALHIRSGNPPNNKETQKAWDKRIANTHHLVKCVNNHDALVEFVKNITKDEYWVKHSIEQQAQQLLKHIGED